MLLVLDISEVEVNLNHMVWLIDQNSNALIITTAMNNIPVIGVMTPEISVFIVPLKCQKQESRLFQFLNGLDDWYATQRSHILLMSPLPREKL